jgi:hypothetical protein
VRVQGQWVSQPYMGRNEDVSAYITTSDRHGPYASPTLPEILWTLKGKKDCHRSHEEGDETEEIAWNWWQLSYGTGGSFAMESVATFVWNRWQVCRGIRSEESRAGLSAVS